MPLDDDSKKLLAINTNKRFYENNRLTFGIASALAIWQRALDQILQGLSGVQYVLDDMIISGKGDDEHLQNLENVLQKLQDNGLQGNIEKYSFLATQYSLLWT
jgi:type IV secretory pathway VirB4 component